MTPLSSAREGASPPTREALDRFDTYQAYLDSFVTQQDLVYLGGWEEARRVVELGHLHGDGELISRQDFAARKAALAAAREAARNPRPRPLLSAGRALEDAPLLRAVADREHSLRRGSMLTVLFVRARNGRGQEVSGYVDLAHRLAADEAGMAEVFARERRLLPQPGDLSCLNWATGALSSSPSPNFEVAADPALGLAFKCRRNRKLLVVDPDAPAPGDHTTRSELQACAAGSEEEYLQAVLFDHVIGLHT